MFLTRLLLLCCLGLTAPALAHPALAQTADTPAGAESPVADLSAALQLDALFEVLRAEGLAQGKTLEDDMFPGRGGAPWADRLAAIYDIPRLQGRFETVLAAELSGDPTLLAESLAFFRSDLGQRIVGLEIEARRAFLDTATEEAARVAADDRFAARDPLVPLLRRFIAAADLVEMNVAGALTGNLAFLTAMAETGVYGDAMPPEQLMSDVWAQEDQIRDDMTSWLYAYLGLAYSPLSPDEMQAYVDFIESPAGKRLNAALFMAFGQVFRDVSQDLGRAAGLAMLGTDI